MMTRVQVDHDSWLVSRWLFLRLLGVVYLVAFLAMADQLVGLIGAEGLAPARQVFPALLEAHGGWAFLRAPSVFWLGHGDAVLQFWMWVGAGLAGMLVLNLAPRLCLLLLWLLYVSVSAVHLPGDPGLFFRWPPDTLTMEAGFLALALVPAGWRPGLGRATPVPRWVRGLLYFLLFRLLVGSAMTKLVHGQDVWLDCTALFYDHETRPHPTWLAAYAKELPMWCLQACVVFMYVVELLVPFLFLWRGRVRTVAGLLVIALMVGISLTGSYRWFPLMTLGLAVLLLRDQSLLAWAPDAWRRRLLAAGDRGADPQRGVGKRLLIAAFVLGHSALATVELADACDGPYRRLPVAPGLRAALAPFHICHCYELFPHIRKERRVIVVEGSDDGVHWQMLENRSNPGPLSRPCSTVAPYHHFLDFLLWMSAFVEWNYSPAWVGFLHHGLLTGYEPTYRLFRRVPWSPERPPRYVRTVLFVYRYANPEQRRNGLWWTRELVGRWAPAVTLDPQGSITAAAGIAAEPPRSLADVSSATELR